MVASTTVYSIPCPVRSIHEQFCFSGHPDYIGPMACPFLDLGRRGSTTKVGVGYTLVYRPDVKSLVGSCR